MVSELSLRHLPDPSDASVSAIPDFSDSSFQIPLAAGFTNDYLLDDNTMDFLPGTDVTLSTPAPRTSARIRQRVTVAELTPKNKTPRAAPVRSSLRHVSRPVIATPKRETVTVDLTSALAETLSPFRHQGTSFKLPTEVTNNDAHLFADLDDTKKAATSSVATSPKQRAQPSVSRLTPELPRFGPLHPSGHPCSSDSDSGHRVVESKLLLQQEDEADPEIKSTSQHKGEILVKDSRRVKSTKRAQSSQNDVLARSKSKRRRSAILSGGITKPAKTKPQRSLTLRAIPNPDKLASGSDQRTFVRNGPTPAGSGQKSGGPEEAGESIVATSHMEMGGLAGTLMSFGQRCTDALLRSQSAQSVAPERPINSAIATAIIDDEQPLDAAGSSVSALAATSYYTTDREAPLTVSQLSPQRSRALATVDAECPGPETGRQADARRPPSPMLRPAKRPISAVPSASTDLKHKRSKISPTGAEEPIRKIKGGVAQHAKVETTDVMAREASASRGRHGSADSRVKEVHSKPRPGVFSTRSAATTQQHGTTKTGSSKQLTHKRGALSHSRSTSRSGDLHDLQKENASDTKTQRLEHEDGNGLRPGHMSACDKPKAAIRSAHPTVPIGFHFESDARAEARKTELEKSASMQTRSRSHAPLPIPDFRAMHAAHELAQAARREQIVPVLPMDVELRTDVRSRERERFDEARRERERETEQQMEERRRQRELEEEQEIRELRRRAVPKANEVPEWYASAPKRAGRKTRS